MQLRDLQRDALFSTDRHQPADLLRRHWSSKISLRRGSGWFEVGGIASLLPRWDCLRGQRWAIPRSLYRYCPCSCWWCRPSAHADALSRNQHAGALNADYVRTARAKGLTENMPLSTQARIPQYHDTAFVTMMAGILPEACSEVP